MASVRMTNLLRNDIFRNADSAYVTANPQPIASTGFLDLVKHAIENSLPNRALTQFLSECEKSGLAKRPHQDTNIPANRDIPEIRLSAGNNDDREQLELRFNTPMSITCINYRTDNFSWNTPTFYVEDLDLNFIPEVRENFDALVEAKAKHNKELRDYRASIRDLLDKCTTLKQLLEIWPAAESLVPSESIQKLHEKVTRKAKAEQIKEEIQFDPTIANQAVLTSKMLGV